MSAKPPMLNPAPGLQCYPSAPKLAGIAKSLGCVCPHGLFFAEEILGWVRSFLEACSGRSYAAGLRAASPSAGAMRMSSVCRREAAARSVAGICRLAAATTTPTSPIHALVCAGSSAKAAYVTRIDHAKTGERVATDKGEPTKRHVVDLVPANPLADEVDEEPERREVQQPQWPELHDAEGHPEPIDQWVDRTVERVQQPKNEERRRNRRGDDEGPPRHLRCQTIEAEPSRTERQSNDEQQLVRQWVERSEIDPPGSRGARSGARRQSR